jgi:stress-induced morphogen
MALRILSEPSSEDATRRVAGEMREAILAALPGAAAEVTPTGPGHFEIEVRCQAFGGRSRVQQQQMVYSAIAHLMRGDAPPVHAIDRLRTLVS